MGPKKIVLIDDNKDLAGVYQRLLKSKSYEVECYLDHDTALQNLCRPEVQAPHLLFLDLMIPGAKAADFLDRLEKDAPAQRKKMRLILFSSMSAEAPDIQEVAKKCDGFYEKPMDLDVFLEIVESNLQEKA